MTQTTPLDQLPPNLPVPKDDGGCRHLVGMRLPDLELPSTRNRRVNLSKVEAKRLVVYAYPMTGRPGVTLPRGLGRHPRRARLHARDVRLPRPSRRPGRLQTEVYGVSVQTTEYQQEMVERLKVPFEVLSDAAMTLVARADAADVHRRRHDADQAADIVASAGRIEHVFYPVFPPDKHAEEVIAWLEAHRARDRSPGVAAASPGVAAAAWPFESFVSVVLATRRKVCASARCGGRRAACPRASSRRATGTTSGFPVLAPSVETMKVGQAAETPAQWAAFTKKYRAEMAAPAASQSLDLLAALSQDQRLLGRLLLRRRSALPSLGAAALLLAARRDDLPGEARGRKPAALWSSRASGDGTTRRRRGPRR